METRKNFGTTIIAAIVSCLLTVISCSTRQTAEDFVPAEPNYDKPSQWYVTDRQGQADIFYIISTETGDYTNADGSICHYADTYADSLRAPLLGEMKGVDTLLSGRLNFYAPYYRQCSLQSFGSDSVARERLPLAVDDVRRAFAHYLKNNNQGRPFILAGFSQGAVIALQLMSEMNDETYARMVAAYIIGTNISQEMLDNNSRIRPAQGADDTGVTICYNSVRDPSCVMTGWERSSVAINPVSWRTDQAPATLITEPSPLLPVAEQPKDTMTVRLDAATGLLLVEGFTAHDYILPLLGVEGNYHTRELWLYRDQLRRNIALRADTYLETRK